MDGEDRVQLGLIHALCKAIEEGKPAAEGGPLLGQLVDYREGHCMSEELLMRLDSDEDFEDHIADHMRMVEALKAMVKDD